MITISELTYSIEGRMLYHEASAVLPQGHKIGLLGRNGTGKTTLFRLLMGEIDADGGRIEAPKGTRIGTVAQEAPSTAQSLMNWVLDQDSERQRLLALLETETDADLIAAHHARLADIDAWSAESRAARILAGLGFDSHAQERACAEFSGGWRMRVALAGVLFAAPDVLLLDEPTNYLDLEGAVWLENFIARYPHAALIITHDKGLLNRSVQGIWHLEGQKLHRYQGGYDRFRKEHAERRANAQQAHAKQASKRAHLQSFVDRFRANASKAKQAQARLKLLSKLEPLPPLDHAHEITFHFAEPKPLAPPLINLSDVTLGYDGSAVLRGVNQRIDPEDRIALLGRNGEGKSTLSKFLAHQLEAMSGKMRHDSKIKIGYFAQHTVDGLDLNRTALDHLGPLLPHKTPSEHRAMLAQFGLGVHEAQTQVANLSGGQKSRLALLLATYHAPHILILDEPTNHLDIESREAMAEALLTYGGAVVIVSHDLEFLKLVVDQLWLVKDSAVAVWNGDLESYHQAILQEKSKNTLQEPKASDPKPAPRKPADASQKQALAKLRKSISSCEQRLEKLEEMRNDLEAALASSDIYTPQNAARLAKIQAQLAKIQDATDQTEALWIKAQEAIDEFESEPATAV